MHVEAFLKRSLAESRHTKFKWHPPQEMSIPFVYENYQTMKKGCATDPCFRGPAKVSNVNLNVSHNAVGKQSPPRT